MREEIEIESIEDQLIKNLPTNMEEKEMDIDSMSKTYKKRKKRNRVRRNREIMVVLSVFILIFTCLSYSFIDYIVNDSKEFIYNSYNSRFSTYADNIIRGSILTADGKVVATTQVENNEEYRLYPYAEMFSHAVGYVDEGMSGLEAEYSFDLIKSHNSVNSQVNNDLSNSKTKGDCLITTLDFDAQKAAYEGMGKYNGAVIAIEPSTGKIVAMVSKPDFDPNTLEEYWSFITDENNDSSILLNRSLQGLYPPGSTFKIITTVAYLRENANDPSAFTYNCTGNLSLDDVKIHCSSNKKHGSEDLKKAFYNSCNCAFADIGTNLLIDKYNDTANSLLLNQELPTQLQNVKKSSFKLDEKSKKGLIGQTAMGQGDTTVTPIYMCMLASAIANDGILMEPYLGDKIVSTDGFLVSEVSPKVYGELFSKEECEILSDYMRAVITSGTADDVDFGNVEVFGKTGTAEFSKNKEEAHSWFVGYANGTDGRQLAVAVIMEEAGYGSKFATPLAAKIFDAYFN